MATDISASAVKELRDRTGAGMMEAKKALVSAGGDVEAAIKHLRESGALKAEKKATRTTSEGRIGGFVAGDAAAIVEVRCETDFVAKNADFVAFAEKVAESMAKAPSVDNPLDVKFVSGGTVGEALKSKVMTIGENLQIGKVTRLAASGSFFGLYIHNNGKIAVLTQIKGERNDAGVTMAKDVAMHAAFTNPIGLNRSAVPADVLATEKEIFTKQAAAEGKPEKILPKIVEGKINAFYKERVLLEQAFVKDPKKSITDVVKEAGKCELVDFAYLALGQ